MATFESTYQAACQSGLLPGVVLLAASSFEYAKAMGVMSLKSEDPKAMKTDTVLALASCTKLMTAISALQLVERGLLSLDSDVSSTIPEVDKFGLIIGFDNTSNQPIMGKKMNHVTLRHLLSHTAGYQYDLMTPVLQKWRASRGEAPWSGPTVEEKSTLPLLFEPGTSWAYGAGADWTGKLIERVTGQSLEEYMSHNIWKPLGIKDITFWPKKRADMIDRLADMSLLAPGSNNAIDSAGFDVTGGIQECLGGGGTFASAEAYMTLLKAVLREDSNLLRPESFTELFKPQLNEECSAALHNLLLSDPQMQEYIGMNLPTSAKKNWSFAGLVSLDDYPGSMRKGTVLWGGVPNITWLIDRQAGICAFAGCQVVPPMTPPIMKLHERFQHEIYKLYNSNTEKKAG